MTNIVVTGKGGIRVEVVLHSITEGGDEIITFLRDYPRIVHAEDLKHRMHSNSAASSRAIPSAKMAEQLTGMPVSFGKNQAGMQAGEEHSELVRYTDGDFGYTVMSALLPQHAWETAKDNALRMSDAFAKAGYHKQVYNRLTEPFQMIRVLTTMTETANFYWLRDDVAADPTLAEVAGCMKEAHKLSKPQVLKPGEWHLPFVDCQRDHNGNQMFFIAEEFEDGWQDYNVLSIEEAIKACCARSAATSFRNENYNLAKCLQVYDRLVNGDKVHAGALEHSAKVMAKQVMNLGTHMTRKDYVNVPTDPSSWETGVSHMDKNRKLWSGNFKSWIQWRKMVPGENYVDNPQQPA